MGYTGGRGEEEAAGARAEAGAALHQEKAVAWDNCTGNTV